MTLYYLLAEYGYSIMAVLFSFLLIGLLILLLEHYE